MKRLRKEIFYGLWAVALVSAAIYKHCPKATEEHVVEPEPEQVCEPKQPPAPARPHNKIRGVGNYRKAFPDLQDVQIRAAKRWGISPVADRKDAEGRKSELVYVGNNPWMEMDRSMTRSIPYLVPRAADLAHTVGRNFVDSLHSKGLPPARVIMTSALRTEADVRKLMRHNGNASPQSCHRYGTTFDICYNRYGQIGRPIRSDSLKWVLSEVLRDLRDQQLCYVKYEVKQGCFHITAR